MTNLKQKLKEFTEYCDLIMDLSADIAHAIRSKDFVASKRYLKERTEATRSFYKFFKQSLENKDKYLCK